MKNAIKKIMAFVLVIAMIAGVLPSVFAASDYVEPFKDVKTTDWFAPYVTYVYEHNPQLMNGMTENTFGPNGTCTRAMAAVILYRLADPVIPSVKPATFTDLDPTQSWYMNGISWAQQNGVVNGVTETTFDPEGLVQREQLVTMIWRYAGKPEVEDDYLKDFRDKEKISVYAREAFNWAISLGIIGGTPEKMLNPQGNATRAEVAKIISVFAQETAPCQHNWGAGQVTKAATCTETGIMTYTCSLCGETKTEVIPMTAHNYVDGVCSVCGAKEPSTPVDPPVNPPVDGDEYALVSEIKDGDEVVIYNVGGGMALPAESLATYYMPGVAVTPENNVIKTENASIVWTVTKNADGTYTFNNGNNVLSINWNADSGKTSLSLDGANPNLAVVAQDGSTNTFNIYSATQTGKYEHIYLEWYAAKTDFSAYDTGSSNAAKPDFGFQFYVKGAEAPEPGPGPEPEPTPGDEYVLTGELKDGDKVIFVNKSVSQAMSATAASNGYNRAGVAVTPVDNKITTEDTTIVWTVEMTEGGFFLKNAEGKKLSIGNKADGGTYNSMGFDQEDNPVWKTAAAATEGCIYLQNTTATGSSGDPKSVEWYAQYSNFSMYYVGSADETLFAMQMYVKGGEPACNHEWDNGEVTTEPWCTVAGEKTFTCELCGDTRTEVILALGHIDEDNNDICDRCRANLAAGDYSIAESVAAGDKIIIVAEFEGKYYAVVNDNTTVKNALNAIEVNVTSEGLVTPDGADILWEICEGEEGTFTLKSSDGKYINNTSGSTTKLSDTGTSYVITCGEGISKITLPNNVGRSLMLRVNAGVPQFRNYADSNATKSGYSAVITIWKAN